MLLCLGLSSDYVVTAGVEFLGARRLLNGVSDLFGYKFAQRMSNLHIIGYRDINEQFSCLIAHLLIEIHSTTRVGLFS